MIFILFYRFIYFNHLQPRKPIRSLLEPFLCYFLDLTKLLQSLRRSFVLFFNWDIQAFTSTFYHFLPITPSDLLDCLVSSLLAFIISTLFTWNRLKLMVGSCFGATIFSLLHLYRTLPLNFPKLSLHSTVGSANVFIFDIYFLYPGSQGVITSFKKFTVY